MDWILSATSWKTEIPNPFEAMNITDLLFKRNATREREGKQADDLSRNRTSDQLHEDYIHLEHRVEKLALISRALWEILSEDKGISEEDLLARVTEIDLRNGHLDGRLVPKVIECPECHHKMSSRHDHCIYCGSTSYQRDIFDEI